MMHGPIDKDRLKSPETPYRQAPHNIEAEQALLGAILINNEAFDRVGSIEPHHFFDPIHARIFEAMRAEVAAARTFTPVTLARHFLDAPVVGKITVSQYLGRLAAAATSVINARDYARTVYDLWVRRELVLIGEDIVNTAYDAVPEFSPPAQIEEAEARLFALGDLGANRSHEASAAQAVESTLRMINSAYQTNTGGRDGLSGLSTGFVDLDRRLGGMAPENLLILAGRPSMGKSALAANIAFNAARQLAASWEQQEMPLLPADSGGRAEKPDSRAEGARKGEVVVYSLEMAVEQLFMRELARKTRIPADRQRRGDINEAEFAALEAAGRNLRQLPIHIDGTGALSIAQLVARSRRRKRLHDTRLIVIDYLQLMASGRNRDNRASEVAEISMALKALAKELKIPILALSQLSRQVENREDKRPQLSDLRESGAIEQDADVVMFVFREEYYLARSEPRKGTAEYFEWEGELAGCKGMAEIIIGKHRHASVGTTTMFFDGAMTEFADLERRRE
jgi:replicative DNA helicase